MKFRERIIFPSSRKQQLFNKAETSSPEELSGSVEEDCQLVACLLWHRQAPWSPPRSLSSGPLDRGRSWGGLLPCLSSWSSLTEPGWTEWGWRGWHSGLISPFSSKVKGPQAGCVHVPHAAWSLSPRVAHWDVWLWYIQVRGSCRIASHSTWAVWMKSWLPILRRGIAETKQFSFFSTKIWMFYQGKNSQGKAVFWQALLVRSLSSPSHNSLNGKFYG